MKKLKKTFQTYFSGSSDEKQQQALCSQHSLQNGKKKGGHSTLVYWRMQVLLKSTWIDVVVFKPTNTNWSL